MPSVVKPFLITHYPQPFATLHIMSKINAVRPQRTDRSASPFIEFQVARPVMDIPKGVMAGKSAVPGALAVSNAADDGA